MYTFISSICFINSVMIRVDSVQSRTLHSDNFFGEASISCAYSTRDQSPCQSPGKSAKRGCEGTGGGGDKRTIRGEACEAKGGSR